MDAQRGADDDTRVTYLEKVERRVLGAGVHP